MGFDVNVVHVLKFDLYSIMYSSLKSVLSVQKVGLAINKPISTMILKSNYRRFKFLLKLENCNGNRNQLELFYSMNDMIINGFDKVLYSN